MAEYSAATFDDKKVRQFLSQLDLNLKKINKLGNDYAVLLNAIVYKDVDKHFQDERGPTGPWQAWSKAYEKKREGGRILRNSGRLWGAFTPLSSFRKEANGIIWYNNAKTESGFPYAFAHNTGGPKLPKRSFMWLSNDAINQVEEQTLKFILGD